MSPHWSGLFLPDHSILCLFHDARTPAKPELFLPWEGWLEVLVAEVSRSWSRLLKNNEVKYFTVLESEMLLATFGADRIPMMRKPEVNSAMPHRTTPKLVYKTSLVPDMSLVTAIRRMMPAMQVLEGGRFR